MIYVFLADGFEEMEAMAPIDLLKRAGVDLQTVGVGGKAVTGRSGIAVTCDITEDEMNTTDCAGVVLPGGPGRTRLADSPVVMETLKVVSQSNGLLAAICAAPSILGQAGLLKGKKACCYPGFEDELAGAEIVFAPVVTDGNVITSRGAGTATEFALSCVSYLVSPEMATMIAEQIVYGR